jgi:anthranilate phosphoribosyltransferase
LGAFGKAITRLTGGDGFGYDEAFELARQLLAGEPSEMDQGAFLAALTAKGPNMDELAAVQAAILEHDTNKVKIDVPGPLLDNAGTGMDRLKTFNVSTAAAIIASSCGAFIARHGSRALTSACGTVDLCENLGIGVEVSVETVKRSVESVGIGLFNGGSPKVHPMALGRILSQITFGSVLNISASLANPASPTRSVRGVHDAAMVGPVAALLGRCGVTRAIVVHGLDGAGAGALDEASTLGKTLYATLDDGVVETGSFEPEDFGLARTRDPGALIASGSAASEADAMNKLLSGQGKRERMDIAALNSALVLYVSGVAGSIEEGVRRSFNALGDGHAQEQLMRWARAQNGDMPAFA